MKLLFEIERVVRNEDAVILYPGIPKTDGDWVSPRPYEIQKPDNTTILIPAANILLNPETGRSHQSVIIMTEHLPEFSVNPGDQFRGETPPFWRRDLRRFVCPAANPLLGAGSVIIGIMALVKREYTYQGVTSTGFTAIIGGLFFLVLGTAFLLSCRRWLFENYEFEKLENSLMLSAFFLFGIFAFLRLAEAYRWI